METITMSSRAPTDTVDMDQSPKTMAAAAMAAAVAERQSKHSADSSIVVKNNDNDDDDKDKAILSRKLFTNTTQDEINGTSIETIWAGPNPETNLSETLRLLLSEIDSMVQSGLGAFHELDAANRQLVQSKELVETKSREALRMGAVEDQSRASLSKLLRAVESSKTESRSSSRSAQIESRLRSTINTLRDERDASLTELSTYRRKLSLAEEELRLTKSKLQRIVQEKHSMERDSRAAISLARSLDNNNSNDMNYYKRKVGELSDRLQASQRKVGELTERLNERSPKKKRSI